MNLKDLERFWMKEWSDLLSGVQQIHQVLQEKTQLLFWQNDVVIIGCQ